MAHTSLTSSAKRSSCSFTSMDYLPDDVLREILLWMPFRSIVKSKCVCKRWLKIISSPSFPTEFVFRQYSFFNTYLTFISPHQLMFGFFPKYYIFDAITHRAPLSPDTLIKGNVCGYSNGLILFCSDRYTTGSGYFVYDPPTKQCFHIPSFPHADREPQGSYAVGFSCNNYSPKEGEKEPHSSRGYWVVIIKTFLRTQYEFEVRAFCSGTREWRLIHVSCPEGFAFAPQWMLSCAFQGFLYFMGKTNIFVFYPDYLVSGIIDYPQDANATNIMSFGYLGCTVKTLRIADISNNDLRVWEMNIPQTWYLVHRTNLTEHLPTRFCSDYYKRVAGFHPSDGDIVYLYSYDNGIFVANLRTNKFLSIPGYDKLDISPFQLYLPPIPHAENDCSTSD